MIDLRWLKKKLKKKIGGIGMPRAPVIGERVEAPKVATVVLGGTEVEVRKTNFRSFGKIVKIAGPYIEELISAFLSSRDDVAEEMKGAVDAIVSVEEEGADEVPDVERESRASEAYATIRRVIGGELVSKLWSVPEDLSKIFALLINIDPEADPEKDPDGAEAWEWFQAEVELDEMLEAFTVIEELNDFDKLGRLLVKTFRELSAKYQISFPQMRLTRRDVTTAPDAPVSTEE